jgi:hypothetical protein
MSTNRRLSGPEKAAALGITIAALIWPVSCSAAFSRLSRVPRQDLFSLSLGKLEDQIDVFEGPGSPGKLKIFMRDGLFFISNGQGRKVMEFSSYGDLLSLVYDPDYAPPPVFLGGQVDGGSLKRVIEHPLREAGEIVVNSRKDFYVEDRLPPDRRVEGEDGASVLDAVVLRFGQDGSYRDYIGQEGLGGTPFPNVVGLHCTSRDDIVVICATREDYGVYWYGDDGSLKHSLSVRRDALPMPPEGKYIASLEKLVPDPDSSRILMKVDYYEETVDASTGAQIGVDYDQSLVWSIDPDDGRIDKPVKVPALKRKDDSGFSDRDYARSYELLGVSPGGRLFFIMPEEDGSFDLLVMDEVSGRTRKFTLAPAGKDIIASDLRLGLDGIISGIFVGARDARVSWWRMDKALGN